MYRKKILVVWLCGVIVASGLFVVIGTAPDAKAEDSLGSGYYGKGDLEHLVLPINKTAPTITIRNRGFFFQAGQPLPSTAPEWELNRSLLTNGGYYLVQFNHVPDDSERSAAAQLGVSFVEYMSSQTWLIYIPTGKLPLIEGLQSVDFISVYEPAYKVAPELLNKTDEVSVTIHFMPDQNTDTLATSLKEIGVTPIQEMFAIIPLLRAELPAELLPKLAGMEEVLWIDEDNPPISLMDNIRSDGYMGTITPQTHGFTGNGILGEVQDDGYEWKHGDLTNVIWTDGDTISVQDHGTCTTGIVFGTGTGNSQATGMLPDGMGAFAYWGTGRTTSIKNLWDGNFNEGNANRHGLFQSNSWGERPFNGEYNTNSHEDDTSAQTYPYVLQLWALGNSNDGMDEGMISPDATSKNVVSVGGIYHHDDANLDNDDYSQHGDGYTPSRGPAADGRQKPDLVGPFDRIFTVDRTGWFNGYNWFGDYCDFSGTSGATPTVAGNAGILYQMYKENFFRNNPTKSNPHSSTIKALLIADAYQYPLDPARQITRNVVGWGTPDMENTYNLGASYHYILDQGPALDSGDSWKHTIGIGGTRPLKISLVWTDPPAPASTGSARALRNNLDLKVTSPTGAVYWGNNGLWDSLWSSSGNGANHWSTSGNYKDDLNNVENVFVQFTTTGTWTVEVIGRTGDVAQGPQSFSLVASRPEVAKTEFDITASSLYSTYMPGSTTTEFILVKNVGGEAGSFKLGVSYKKDTMNDKDAYHGATIFPSGFITLNPGESQWYTVNWKVPSYAPTGQYQIAVNCWWDPYVDPHFYPDNLF